MKVKLKKAGKVKEFKLHHPVMMDNDFAYWQKLNTLNGFMNSINNILLYTFFVLTI